MIRSPDWQPTVDDPEIQEYLREAAGEEGIKLFQFILDNEPVTGEEIQEAHADEKPSDVRKLLYAMMQRHALEYHKDTDSKGWETFTWQTDLPELRLIHLRSWQSEATTLQARIQIEKDHAWYACGHDHARIMFEDAMDQEFKCPECGAPMDSIDNSDHVELLKERLSELAPALTS
jgi:transcription initiation factor TFIIE subunit alpha